MIQLQSIFNDTANLRHTEGQNDDGYKCHKAFTEKFRFQIIEVTTSVLYI